MTHAWMSLWLQIANQNAALVGGPVLAEMQRQQNAMMLACMQSWRAVCLPCLGPPNICRPYR